jgi:hypothetical protein
MDRVSITSMSTGTLILDCLFGRTSNAIVYAPDRSLLLSMRAQSWVLKIDYANGYRLGKCLAEAWTRWKLHPAGGKASGSFPPIRLC